MVSKNNESLASNNLVLAELQAIEQRLYPSIGFATVGGIIFLIPAFEYGLNQLGRGRDLVAHGLFYGLLMGLAREFLIRKTSPSTREHTESRLKSSFQREQILFFVSAGVAGPVLIHTRHASLILPVFTYLCAFVFYSAGKFSSRNLRLLAFVLVGLATLSTEALTSPGGMAWLPVFTSLLAACFFSGAAFRK